MLGEHLIRSESAVEDRRRAKMRRKMFVLATLIFLTVADGVLVVVLFDKYGDRYSQYINQGTAAVYCVVSMSMILGRKFLLKRHVEENVSDAKSDDAPAWVLIFIGILNGSANFFMATSQPHTPGLTQSLLNQLTIPIVLVLSAIFLKKRSSLTGLFAATLIVIGTAVSAFRPGGSDQNCGDNTCYVISSLLFALAQLFLGGERVFEEHTFDKNNTDVLNMFAITLLTQFLLGFALYPAQTKEPFGDLVLDEIPRVIWDGMRCNVGLGPSESVEDGPSCGFFSAFIFFAYCAVDFCCYGYGLYVIRNGGAREMVISSAVALPIQQLILTLPLLGVYRESFFWGDFVALVLVLGGFVIFQVLAPEGSFAASEREYLDESDQSTATLNDDNSAVSHETATTTSALPILTSKDPTRTGRLESIKSIGAFW